MAKTKDLSTGFAGANTSGIEQRNARRLKRLDTFTDEFSPPGTGESGLATDKLDRPFGDKHTDTSSKDSTSSLKKLSYPGPDGDENQIDLESYRMEAGIKPMKDQFPGSDVSEFDARATDPGAMGAQVRHETDEEENESVKRFHLKRLSGKVDEDKWAKAKDDCIKQYGRIKWAVVMHIYQEMGGT